MEEYLDSLIQEVKSRMKSNAATDETAFIGFIDEVIEQWIAYGQLDDENDVDNLRELAKGMWESVQESLNKKLV